jgi:hypothetical protein
MQQLDEIVYFPKWLRKRVLRLFTKLSMYGFTITDLKQMLFKYILRYTTIHKKAVYTILQSET